jgi:hypothetical protein
MSLKVVSDTRFFYYGQRKGEGVEWLGRIGVGPDGILWMTPAMLGVHPDVVKDMVDFPQPVMLVDAENMELYLNVRAVAETFQSPEERRKMMDAVDAAVDKLHPTNFR